MDEHPVSTLARRFSRFACRDVLASVGALQLMPENARRAERLELAACGAAAADPGGSTHALTRGDLDNLVNGPELAHPRLVSQEEPVGGWFVESVTFIGGAYRILPGITTDATLILRHLGMAIALRRESFSDPDFGPRCCQLFQAVLTLSEMVANRAGLARGTLPTEPQSGSQIEIPSVARLAQLRCAVTFSQSEFDAILSRCHADVTMMDPLVVELASVRGEHCSPNANPLQASPIVRVDGEYVVANPSGLAAALRHQIVCMAMEASIADELASRLSEVALTTTLDCLRRMDIRPAGTTTWGTPDGMLIADGLLAFDRDKAVYACVLSDDLRDYDTDTVFGTRPSGDAWPALDSHLDRVAYDLLSGTHAPNEILVLVLMSGIGRSWVFGIGERCKRSQYELLLLSISDLEVMAHLEGRKSLLLWKLARSARVLREKTNVFDFVALNEYGFFRDRDYSFYLSDDVPATVLCLDTSWEGRLQREFLECVDRHGVLSYDGCHASDVVLLHGERNVPIYAEPATLGKRVAVLVEGYAIPIWITSPKAESVYDRRNRRSVVQIADMIAYWLWQVMPSLDEWFNEAVAPRYSVFVISVGTDSPLDEYPGEFDDEPAPSPFSLVAFNGEIPALVITLHSAVMGLLGGADNEGEKVVMSAILRGMRECAPASHQRLLPNDRVTTMIEAHAGPSQKKMMIVVRADRDPELDPHGLPDYRTVDPCDENELLDDLGAYLTGEKGLTAGDVPDDQRKAVLNDVVAWYFRGLENLVRTLNPEGLLEWFVAHHEALLYERASGRLTLATRLACFESHASLRKKWAEEYSTLATAALSIRFIIEYVAARPPRGLRPISNSVHDRLLAIACGIINVGFQSDIVQFGLSDPKLAILRSGRLGRDFDAYAEASRVFMGDFTDAQIRQAPDSFASRWVEPPSSDTPSGFSDVDEASREEFGHRLTDLRDFWGAAEAVAAEVSSSACRMRRDAFAERVAEELRWSRTIVDAVIDGLAIPGRDEFLVPPPPFKRSDVYPWRFTRPYSYLRKPFLLVSGASGPEIITGHRHLQHSWKYFAHLCLDGRIEARSPRMKRVMSRLASVAAEDFNDSVAGRLQELDGFLVKRRVKKAGQLRGRLAPPGDIDVLAVSRRKRTVFLIECKNLALARTPREMANELSTLIRGSGSERSTVAKHVARAQWAEDNLPTLLKWLGLGYSNKWCTEALIVLDRRPITARLADPPIPILGFVELLEYLQM